MTTENPTSRLTDWQQVLDSEGIDAGLQSLAKSFQNPEELHRLFEVRQMQVRRQLGLAVHLPPKLDTLSTAQQDELEKGLLDACREVGLALLDDGQIADGWMYLRAVGDKSQVAEHLKRLPIKADRDDDEHDDDQGELIEQAIHLALYEGIDPAWGLGLLLDYHGTCNSITAVSGLFPNLDRDTQAAVASTLLKHLHAEVLTNINNDREHRKLPPATVDSSKESTGPIAQILAEHPVLVSDQSHHTDLSHLMSTMQFARSTRCEEDWRLALDLAEYGGRLAPQLMTAGEEPFVRFYPMHRAYFAALLDIDTDANVGKFATRAESVDRDQYGPHAAEVYIDLLARMGRFAEATSASAKLLPPGSQIMGVAPSLLELSEKAGDFSSHLELAKSRGDLLAYAQGLLAKAGAKK